MAPILDSYLSLAIERWRRRSIPNLSLSSSDHSPSFSNEFHLRHSKDGANFNIFIPRPSFSRYSFSSSYSHTIPTKFIRSSRHTASTSYQLYLNCLPFSSFLHSLSLSFFLFSPFENKLPIDGKNNFLIYSGRVHPAWKGIWDARRVTVVTTQRKKLFTNVTDRR